MCRPVTLCALYGSIYLPPRAVKGFIYLPPRAVKGILRGIGMRNIDSSSGRATGCTSPAHSCRSAHKQSDYSRLSILAILFLRAYITVLEVTTFWSLLAVYP